MRATPPGLVLPVLLVGLLGMGLGGCQGQNARTEAGGDRKDIQLGQLVEDPAAFVSEQVTVNGEILEVIDAHSVRIGEPAGGGGSLLVVTAGETALGEGEVVEVTGQVTSDFAVTQVERTFGAELSEEKYRSFVGEHYLLAFEVDQRSADDGRATPPAERPRG